MATVQYGSALHIANGSRLCLVWCNGLGGSFLNTDFLRSQPGLLLDGLFFVDAGFDWYTGGFKDIAEDFAASVRWLEDFLRRHGYEGVFIGGQSSGAYAAMRVARRIHPTAIIAFSPQTRNIIDARGHRQPAVDLEDLALAYSDWDAGFPIYIHLARSERENRHEYFWDDWEQIRPFLDKDNVAVVRHPFDTHVISLRLYALGLFYKTLLSHVMLHLPDRGSGEPTKPEPRPELATDNLAPVPGAQPATQGGAVRDAKASAHD